jgi:hypothetical protein
MSSHGKHQRYPKGTHKDRSDIPREPTKTKNKGIPRELPYKNILTTAKLNDFDPDEEAAGLSACASINVAAAVAIASAGEDADGDIGLSCEREARCPAYITNSFGFRICGRPVNPGKDRCNEHVRN